MPPTNRSARRPGRGRAASAGIAGIASLSLSLVGLLVVGLPAGAAAADTAATTSAPAGHRDPVLLAVTGPAETLRLVLLVTLLLSIGGLALVLTRHVLAKRLLQDFERFERFERIGGIARIERPAPRP